MKWSIYLHPERGSVALRFLFYCRLQGIHLPLSMMELRCGCVNPWWLVLMGHQNETIHFGGSPKRRHTQVQLCTSDGQTVRTASCGPVCGFRLAPKAKLQDEHKGEAQDVLGRAGLRNRSRVPSGAFCQGLLGLGFFANKWVSFKPLKVKLLGGEQKATEV